MYEAMVPLMAVRTLLYNNDDLQCATCTPYHQMVQQKCPYEDVGAPDMVFQYEAPPDIVG